MTKDELLELIAAAMFADASNRLTWQQFNELDAAAGERWRWRARAAFAALNAAGYAIVPIKPSEEMLAAGSEADMAGFNGATTPIAHIWTSMLSAAALRARASLTEKE